MTHPDAWSTCQLLSTLARLVETPRNSGLSALGLTHAGVTVLDILETTGPLTQACLASVAHVRPQTMGQTLSGLESRGYINRAPTRDRRLRPVSISDSGRDARERAHDVETGPWGGGSTREGVLREMLLTVIRSLRTGPLPGHATARARVNRP